MQVEYKNSNGVNVTSFVDRGLTKLFKKKEDAIKYAKRKHSYFYLVYSWKKGEIKEDFYAVPS